MKVTRQDIRNAAETLLSFIEKQKIETVKDLEKRVGMTYLKGSVKIIATPNAPGMTPDTFAAVYCDAFNPGGILRAGITPSLGLVKMVIKMGTYLNELGYHHYNLDGQDNIAQKKEVMCSEQGKSAINLMKRELTTLAGE